MHQTLSAAVAIAYYSIPMICPSVADYPSVGPSVRDIQKTTEMAKAINATSSAFYGPHAYVLLLGYQI